MSAANAAADCIRTWLVTGTGPGETVGMAVYNDKGYYGVQKDIMFSFPCMCVGGEWIVKEGENFYKSIGFNALPQSFYEKSSMYPLPDDATYKKNNHASAWHMNLENDLRCLMSVEPTAGYYETIHHDYKDDKLFDKLLKMLDPTCNKKHNLKTKKKRMRHKITKKKY